MPLLLAGLMSRAGLLELGSSFHFLASNRALAILALATILEIVADKIPAVDHGLDALSTVLRPLAGSVLAASAFGRIADPFHALALGVVVGAPAALVPHAGKAALRAASTAFTAGIANPLLSLAEDMGALVLFALAVLVPIMVALGLLLVLALLIGRFRSHDRVPAS